MKRQPSWGSGGSSWTDDPLCLRRRIVVPYPTMSMPVLLAASYLAVNLPLMIWLEVSRACGRPLGGRLSTTVVALRYGPPLLGALYLVTIAGDWFFVLFVLGFFAGAAFLMDGLFSTIPPSSTERTGDGWQDPGAVSWSDRDRR